MANRYANLVGSNKIKDEYGKINTGFDSVQADIDQLQVDLDQEIADREQAVQAVDERVDEIIQGGGPDKDAELVDIRTTDPSYTPQRTINVAGDVTRDMQAQFAAHKADIVASGIAGYARAYTDGNLDTLNKTGWVQGTNMAGSPDLTRFYYVLHVEGFANGVGAYQLAVRNTSGDREMHLRVKATGTWLDWVRIIDETYGDNKYFQQSEYETGTWTPTLQFGGSSTGITYADRFGRYTKIGNMVTCEIDIVLSNKGSATGDAQIAGLPYPSASSRPYHNNIGGFAGVSLPTDATGMAYYIPNNNSVIALRAVGDNLGVTTAFDNTHFTDGSFLRAVITYFV